MNPLLGELDRAERDAALPDDPEHERALRLLSWPQVCDRVARGCRTRRAAEAMRSRRPLVDAAAVARLHALQDELRPALEDDDPPPITDPSDALDLLDRPRPWRFDGSDLLHLASSAVSLDVLRDWILKRRDAAPTWSGGAARLDPLGALSGPIMKILDRDGRVKDDASPLLSRLRRDARDRERQVRSSMNRLMAEAQNKGWANGPEVTLRGDRFCLPLKAGSKRRVEGIVHARSSSGGTIFVEPSDVVALQNDLVECRLEAAAEADRLLLELGSLVETHAPAFAESAAFLLRVDEACAALRWSRSVDGIRPELAPGAAPDIQGARHPLLLDRADVPAVIPLDLAWPDGCRALVVSGPNAGGKSVALKGLGVHVLTAQCGWDIPAAEGTRLPLVGRLYVDLGDDQSIARSLSSFSAHLDHLGRFLAGAGPDTLVLCDELGSGTDPDEGTALAHSVLEALVERGALVLATTHYGLLKAAVDEHPRMANAAMDFDEATLTPLYTLRVGVPGASHAFDIASRMRFPADLLDRARERVGEERFRIERLLTELGTRARNLAEKEREAERLEAVAAKRAADLGRRLDGVDGERKRLLDEARRAGEAFLAEARRTMEKVVRDLRSEGADSRTIRYGRDELERLAGDLPQRRTVASEPKPVAEGDRVRIPHLGWTGVVVEVRGSKVVADASGTRLTLDAAAVEPLEGEAAARPDAKRPTSSSGTGAWDWSGAGDAEIREIDLRGYRAEEGWEALDKLLDRAIPAGTREVGVIHGHGTGRLRAYLRQRLKADPRVASFGDPEGERGDSGKTVVRLDDPR